MKKLRFEPWQWTSLTAYLVILNIVIGMLIFMLWTEYSRPQSIETDIGFPQVVQAAPLPKPTYIKQPSLGLPPRSNRLFSPTSTPKQKTRMVNATAVDVLPQGVSGSTGGQRHPNARIHDVWTVTLTPPPLASVRIKPEELYQLRRKFFTTPEPPRYFALKPGDKLSSCLSDKYPPSVKQACMRKG